MVKQHYKQLGCLDVPLREIVLFRCGVSLPAVLRQTTNCFHLQMFHGYQAHKNR